MLRCARRATGLAVATTLAVHWTCCQQEAPSDQETSAQPCSHAQECARLHAARLPVLPQGGSEHFSVYNGQSGASASIADVVAAMERCDVVMLGECHDDPVAHSLEAFLLVSLASRRQKSALSLECFERDTQTVLDEYLAGFTREADMVQDARAWANYESDYRPLVELAKAVGLPIIAANAPRRYVGAVGREPGALRESIWPAQTYRWLPSLPLPTPSHRYMAHLHAAPAVLRADQLGLEEELGSAPPSGAASQDGAVAAHPRCPYIANDLRGRLLQPMLLWDATMA